MRVISIVYILGTLLQASLAVEEDVHHLHHLGNIKKEGYNLFATKEDHSKLAVSKIDDKNDDPCEGAECPANPCKPITGSDWSPCMKKQKACKVCVSDGDQSCDDTCQYYGPNNDQPRVYCGLPIKCAGCIPNGQQCIDSCEGCCSGKFEEVQYIQRCVADKKLQIGATSKVSTSP